MDKFLNNENINKQSISQLADSPTETNSHEKKYRLGFLMDF